MPTYIVYGKNDTNISYGFSGATYTTVREGTGSSTTRANAQGSQNLIGCDFDLVSTTYSVRQQGINFDLRTVSGTLVSAILTWVQDSITSGTIELRYHSGITTTYSNANFIPFSSLSSYPVAATLTVTGGLSGTTSSTSLSNISNFTAGQLNNWLALVHGSFSAGGTPVSVNQLNIRGSEYSGTASDPYLTIKAGLTVRSTGTVSSTPLGNLSVSYPSTIVANDILCVMVTASDNVVSTMPAGWTLKQGTNNGTGSRTEVWWYRADGTETGTVTVTRSGGGPAAGLMSAIAGAATTGDPIEAISASPNSTASTSVATASLTGVTAGSLIGFLAATRSADTDLSSDYSAYQAISAYSGTAPTFVEETEGGLEGRPIVVATAGGDNAGGGSASVTIGIPSTAQAGDVLIVWVTVRGTTTTVTRSSPAWTLYDSLSDGTTAITRLLWYAIPTSGGDRPGNNISFTLSSALKATCLMAVVRNCNNTTPIDASARQANASSTACTFPAVTPVSSNTTSIVYGGTAIGTTPSGSTLATTPVGYTFSVSAATTGGQANTRTTSAMYTPTASATAGRSSAGTALGSGSITFAAAAANVGWQIALAPATTTANYGISLGFASDNFTLGGTLSGRTATLAVSALSTGVLISFSSTGTAILTKKYYFIT